MDDIWLDALRFNKWANLQLLDDCSNLSEEQLQLSSPGTYGTIQATLVHLLSAEQRYVKRLGGPAPQLSENDGFPGISALESHASRSGDELMAVAGRLKPGDKTPVKFPPDPNPLELDKSVIVVQAIHHGNDHRTHICTILGQNAIPHEDLDVWTYAYHLHKGVKA